MSDWHTNYANLPRGERMRRMDNWIDRAIKEVAEEKYGDLAKLAEERKVVMKLFWVAAVQNPTVNEQEDGVEPKIVLEPQCVLAPDEASAVTKAAAKIKEDVPLSRLDVKVSPF